MNNGYCRCDFAACTYDIMNTINEGVLHVFIVPDFAACTYDIMNTINEAKTCVLLLCIHCIGVKQPDFAACTYDIIN
jgi:hypothetical protein